MISTTPLVDARTAAQLRAEVASKLKQNVPEWVGIDPATGEVNQADEASAALIGVFSRFAEIAIQRLNQVPDKNFLAFLDLLGVSRLPPQPARVPLTFTLAPGSVADPVVPAGTQVAAAPGEGEKDPVVFETERELTVLPLTLRKVVTVDARCDLIADHERLLAEPAASGARVFAGDTRNEHVIYVGHGGYLSYPEIKSLTLAFDTQDTGVPMTDPRDIQWEIWTGTEWREYVPSDATNSMRVSGNVTFTDITQVPDSGVNGVVSRWLRARLMTPVSPSVVPAMGMVRAEQLPLLSGVRLSAAVERLNLMPEIAFTNGQAVDVTKPFHPFGERPKLGDAFYVGQREAFANAGADITIDVSLLAAGTPSDDLELKWEMWTTAGWTLLGTSKKTGPTPAGFGDTTNRLTTTGKVTFRSPQAPALTTVNGVESHWLRVQIARGNFGLDAHYVSDGSGGYTLQLSTLKAPVVNALSLGYSLVTPPSAAEHVLAYNNRQFEDLGALMAFVGAGGPFRAFSEQLPTLYIAFALPPARKTFPNRTVSLYHALHLPQYGEKMTPLDPDSSIQSAMPGTEAIHRYTLVNTGSEALTYDLATTGGMWSAEVIPAELILGPGASATVTVKVTVPALNELPGENVSDHGSLLLQAGEGGAIHSVSFETRVGDIDARRRTLRWEYWNGEMWTKLAAIDGTDRLTRPGVVEFLGPGDFAQSTLFGEQGYWIRASFELGDDGVAPRVRTLLPNTTLAAQTVTLRNEILGSSDASEDQRFRTVRSPVLVSQQLEVREQGPLSQEELDALEAAHGVRGVTPAENGREIWVRWIEVPDFHGSGSQDRHYVLDRFTGEVQFGDGLQGRIPPRGIGNIRMALYQTGGGAGGNRTTGTVVQMKTTVPYIQKVYNPEPAAGGFAAESQEAMVARAPRLLRHGERAVAFEDYEDLARSASSEVARAKCIPLRRLDVAPLGSEDVPGAVSVIVVPATEDAKPLPSTELLARTERFLRAHSPVTATISVVGPLYLRVDVSIDVAITALDSATRVEQAIQAQLDAFLHPLTGGRDGAGWDFGREPYLSDLHAVIGGLPGVDHIRRLSFTPYEELTGVKATNRFLVYSGQHDITLTFVGAE